MPRSNVPKPPAQARSRSAARVAVTAASADRALARILASAQAEPALRRLAPVGRGTGGLAPGAPAAAVRGTPASAGGRQSRSAGTHAPPHAPARSRANGQPLRGWSADLKLVSAPVMRRLNAAYRRKDYATDILSFPAPTPFRAQGHLGELVICLAVLSRQAREQGHSPADELDVLLLHGVLHLLGFDHEKGAREAAAQARWETRLLTGIAVRKGTTARKGTSSATSESGRRSSAAGSKARGLIRRSHDG